MLGERCLARSLQGGRLQRLGGAPDQGALAGRCRHWLDRGHGRASPGRSGHPGLQLQSGSDTGRRSLTAELG